MRKMRTLGTLFVVAASVMLAVPQTSLPVLAAEKKPVGAMICNCGYTMEFYTYGMSDEEYNTWTTHVGQHASKGENTSYTSESYDNSDNNKDQTSNSSTGNNGQTDNKPSNNKGQTNSIGTTVLQTKKITYNSATLTWDKVSGATKYEIQYKKAGGNWKRLTTTTKTSYTHKKLKTGGTYWYQVRAVKNTTNGKWSNTLIVKTSLDNIKNLKAKAVSGKKVSLTWKKVSGAKQYVILRSTSKNGKYKVVGKSGKASYTDKGLKGGKKYYYKVYAVSGSCKTKETKPVTVKTKRK